MKVSSASSGPTTAPRPTVPPSAGAPTSASQPSPTADGPVANGFSLAGVSTLPDPATHAYRKDLADAALAGLVIASHYADPLVRRIVAPATAHSEPSLDSPQVGAVQPGDRLRMLDCSRGWAWGYLPDGRVAYVTAAAVSA